jgi:hypothetical protein
MRQENTPFPYPMQTTPWEGDFGLILGLRGFGAGCIGFHCFR